MAGAVSRPLPASALKSVWELLADRDFHVCTAVLRKNHSLCAGGAVRGAQLPAGLCVLAVGAVGGPAAAARQRPLPECRRPRHALEQGLLARNALHVPCKAVHARLAVGVTLSRIQRDPPTAARVILLACEQRLRLAHYVGVSGSFGLEGYEIEWRQYIFKDIDHCIL